MVALCVWCLTFVHHGRSLTFSNTTVAYATIQTHLRHARPHAREQRDQHPHHPVPQVQHQMSILPSPTPIVPTVPTTPTAAAIGRRRPEAGQGRQDVRGEVEDDVVPFFLCCC